MGEWINWEGRECPLPEGTLVDVMFRNGEKSLSKQVGIDRHVAQAYWNNDGFHLDIVAYRLCETKPKPEPMKTKTIKVLTPEGEELKAEFEKNFGPEGNCSCHISPPCGSCTHPGNPTCLEESEGLWQTIEVPVRDESQFKIQSEPVDLLWGSW